MEFILGIIVIFVLLLCMGASIGFIASLALILVGAFIVFMAGFFIYATIIMMSCKKAKGRYIRSETVDKSKIPYAVYLIDNNECKNMLPLEVMFQNKIYQNNKSYQLYNFVVVQDIANSIKAKILISLIVLLMSFFISNSSIFYLS